MSQFFDCRDSFASALEDIAVQDSRICAVVDDSVGSSKVNNIIGRPLLRSTSAEASPLGAAYLAGLGVDVWRSLAQIEELPRPREWFEPHMPAQDRAALYAGWQTAE